MPHPHATLTRAQLCAMLGATAAAALFPRAASAEAMLLDNTPDKPPAVVLGADRFINDAWSVLRGKRLSLVTNHTGRLANGEWLIDAIKRNPHIKLTSLFAPEHGLRGTHTAGSSFGTYIDAPTGLPVFSLYGKTRKPTPVMLDDVDVILFDIQDVGARTYTYISTLALVMQAAAEQRKTVWVLDRPNPIGGDIVEGPVLEQRFSSFIGLHELPMRHGLTMGEVARLYKRTFHIDCDLQVVEMQNYRRSMVWTDTGLPWVATSPNIQHFATAVTYLTTGPIGAAGIDNGIGSSRPFGAALARNLDGGALAAYLNARRLAGVAFRPWTWIPQSGFWSGTPLSGVAIDVHDPHVFYAVRAGVEILCAVRRIAPSVLRYSLALDTDWGTDSLRTMLISGASPEAMEAHWRGRLATFIALREFALLYS